jgi:hypothetical protein
MKKYIYVIFLWLSGEVSSGELVYKNISLIAPDGWEIKGSVIYSSGQKIGELISKSAWGYDSGKDFVQSFRRGFFDDPDGTVFISSGEKEGVFWVCRASEYEESAGEVGVWFVRRFWVDGPILTLYSHKGCDSGFSKLVKIALTMVEE